MTDKQKEYIITEDIATHIERKFNSGTSIPILRSRPYNEVKIRREVQEEIMDKFGILHGEAAERFNEYLNDPDPVKSPEGKALIQKAWDLAHKKTRPCSDCPFTMKHSELAEKMYRPELRQHGGNQEGKEREK